MQSVDARQGETSTGTLSMNPWINPAGIYSVYEINLGTNPLSKIEVVSALNSFNLARWQYLFNTPESSNKYNPKVYLGAVQSVAYQWIYDRDSARQNLAQGAEKSGSWP